MHPLTVLSPRIDLAVMRRALYWLARFRDWRMRLAPRSLGLFTAFALLTGSVPAAASEIKAVVELFTSQGCSSCPKADRLLGEFADNPNLIALSLSVDYWDYLGWRDTLAMHVHSARQKGYANQRGARQVYTPQIVVNGVTEAIGNDRGAIDQAILKADNKSKIAVPVVLKRDGGNVDLEVGAGAGPAASIWIVSITRKAPVAIERGENRGKTITYHNVVRSWVRVGDWKGSAVRKSLSIAELAQSGADAAAVIVQSGSLEAPGPIRGAAMIALD
jgi:hypothetical protein